MVRALFALLTIITLVMHSLVGCCPGHQADTCAGMACVNEHQPTSICRHSHSSEKAVDPTDTLSRQGKHHPNRPCRNGGSCPLSRCQFVPVVRVSVPSLCSDFGFAAIHLDDSPADVCSRLRISESRNLPAVWLLDVHPRREMTGVWLI
jgi:hypothetical protein